MGDKSHFKSDLQKEKQLAILLDSMYHNHLKNYGFKRISDLNLQHRGVDLILIQKNTQKTFFVDEKAQLDYVNDDLPTFAFEINYQKNGKIKPGWLYDPSKKTDFYALVTAIYADEPQTYTSCKITFVNRPKLIDLLTTRKLTQNRLEIYWEKAHGKHGKFKISELDSHSEGYLYASTQNKAEKPFNLILKLDFLMENGVAKRFV
ncbi:hypothetical protein HPE56_18210 [Maribacter sp. ANRC-HE7]|uniref:Uncharacterized protein n=1 Tax=Maribacter aquimaris TaxID=2737171 RepID=A0ABR7V4L3_9FLAO|nr:hypothetical protein [Maribacter aquimaris]MBD0779739.1 hypothetical protein [Maribacter aquimaris]